MTNYALCKPLQNICAIWQMIHEIELDLINTIREIENLTILQTCILFIFLNMRLKILGKGDSLYSSLPCFIVGI